MPALSGLHFILTAPAELSPQLCGHRVERTEPLARDRALSDPE